MLELSFLQYLLSVVSGFLVGFSLGLIGGGGSILAIPLLLYFVGLAYIPLRDPSVSVDFIDHLVIGTTALSVGLNAYINTFMHWRHGNVRVLEGLLFSAPGVVGAYVGARAGLGTRGPLLLVLFGVLMIVIAVMILRGRDRPQTLRESTLRRSVKREIKIHKLVPAGFVVGFASGFFGIGGGFLIVPGLLFSTSLDMLEAVGTSLIAVGTFGLATATTYALAGEIDVIISLLYLAGGVLGGFLGARIASGISRKTLRKIFSAILILVAIYIIYQNISSLT
ncbi:MAG: sulfite exporter TauE/SafE family protein [Sulfolobales archaeon]